MTTAAALAAPEDPPIDPNDARILWRWVGISTNPEQPCPAAFGWEEERLFEDPELPVPPPGLARYCVYELPDDTPFSNTLRNNLQALLGNGSLSAVEPDQMALSAEAEGQLPPRLFRQLSEHFLREVGQPIDPLSFPADGDSVRLTLLDTQPSGANPELFTQYTSAHGYTLATLIERMICNGAAGDCAADVRTRLTLGNVCFDQRSKDSACRNGLNGGWFGAQTDLARAIRNEVAEWTNDTTPRGMGEQQHLILNLSLGWNRRFGGNQGFNAMPLAVAAVYSALQDASCRGALVLAAAGNQHGGPNEPGGPMYPAAWEQRAAPNFLQCRLQLIEQGGYTPPWAFPSQLTSQNDRPLVVAIGGVRVDNSIIFNGRPNGGEPTLVAFADHAATESLAIPNTPTITLTGTSVASAVVSAAAAVAWRFKNALPTRQLLDRIALSGTDVGREADFCLNGRGGGANACPNPVPNVRRVTLCATIECVRDDNCAGSYPSCPTPIRLELTGVDDIAPTSDFATITDTLVDPGCDGIVTHYDPLQGIPANPCLAKQYHGINSVPWVDPQPGDLPCPNCFVQFMSPGTFYYEIDPQLAESFTDITLQCGNDAFVLPFPTLDSLDFGAMANVKCPVAEPVQLLMRDSGGRTHISPVLYIDPITPPNPQ
ncbi:MAG: S8/S53 family peptidase [Pseudomonadota bacterium]